MKNIILLLLLTCFIFACAEKEPPLIEKVKSEAEAMIKENMNDPESYDFVAIELVDSILYKENVEGRKQQFKRDVDYNKSQLESSTKYSNEFPDNEMWKENIVKHQAEIERNERIVSKIDSIEATIQDILNDVASYTYEMTIRGNNALGAKVINTYYIQTEASSDHSIVNITTEKHKVALNAGGFPGYLDMITKNMSID